MVIDTERNYTGTNIVVVTLMILVVLVAGYLAFIQVHDVADDHIGIIQRSEAFR